MRLLIEIATAALLVICIATSSAAFAAGRRSADGLSCAVSLPQNATPVQRCTAIKRQCGGKFFASACGNKLMSAAN